MLRSFALLAVGVIMGWLTAVMTDPALNLPAPLQSEVAASYYGTIEKLQHMTSRYAGDALCSEPSIKSDMSGLRVTMRTHYDRAHKESNKWYPDWSSVAVEIDEWMMAQESYLRAIRLCLDWHDQRDLWLRWTGKLPDEAAPKNP